MGLLKAQLQQADTEAFLWVQRKFCYKRQSPLVRLVSHTGDGWLYPILAAVALVVDYEANVSFLYACLLAFGLQVPLYMLLKRKFKRNRPADYLATFEARIQPSDKFSFPSGHTAAAMVMAVQVACFFPPLALLAFCWSAIIGASRVLLGVHFPGDILAGISLGGLCALLGNEILGLLAII